MGWSIGYDGEWQRDIGYSVPSVCDHPGCNTQIDRGLSFVCGGEPYGGDDGCGLFFCGNHLSYVSFINDNGDQEVSTQLCDPCCINIKLGGDNYKLFAALYEPKPDTKRWVRHKLTDPSWEQWREENPTQVLGMRIRLNQVVS